LATNDPRIEQLLLSLSSKKDWWQSPLEPMEMLEYAKRDLGPPRKSELGSFLGRWFRNNDSVFWRAWDSIRRPAKSEVVWNHRAFRELLFLPVEHIILLGLLSKTGDDVRERFADLQDYFDCLSETASDSERLKVLQLLWQGREGVISRVSSEWLKREPTLKGEIGKALNNLKTKVEAALEERRAAIQGAADQAALLREREDLSLPGVARPLGSRHPLRQTFEEIERIFLSLGYSVVAGPEMETPYYNFEALNIPEHHPARDNMDTFYMAPPFAKGAQGKPLLLRTHTSPMQVRAMEKQQPPVRIIVPGKVYRRDNPDATHGFMFHQIEGLAVDEGITFCDFKGTVDYFVREFLGPQIKTRLRPSYFPFTEPSVEVDATCVFCGGKGCNVCKQSGWIELFGAGMVNPAVYGFVNYDAKKYTGFAFGLGVERLTQLKYNINDLQLYFQNDVRFLRQFA
jgi:phenylalanyl-tRNA synthetase alpha chain